MNKNITNEKTLNKVFLIGIILYGIFLVHLMGKQTQQTMFTLATIQEQNPKIDFESKLEDVSAQLEEDLNDMPNLNTWNEVTGKQMALADMPPIIELRKENQLFVTYGEQ